jgi:hypothetical protein
MTVKQGETLRLRFGILFHSAPADRPANLREAYAHFLALTKD